MKTTIPAGGSGARLFPPTPCPEKTGPAALKESA